MSDTDDPMLKTQQMTIEERLDHVCTRLERASKRLQIGDHMMALLDHDNSMALYALHEFAKKLEAKEVDAKLAKYIEDRGQLLREIRGALREIGTSDTMRPVAMSADG